MLLLCGFCMLAHVPCASDETMKGWSPKHNRSNQLLSAPLCVPGKRRRQRPKNQKLKTVDLAEVHDTVKTEQPI